MSSISKTSDLERQAICDCYLDLVDDLNFDDVITQLTCQGVLKYNDSEDIKRIPLTKDRVLKLLFKIKTHDGGWQHLLNSLETVNQKYLKQVLIERLNDLKLKEQLAQNPANPIHITQQSTSIEMANAKDSVINSLSTEENLIRRDAHRTLIRDHKWNKVELLGFGTQADVYLMKSKSVPDFNCTMKVVRLFDSKTVQRTHEECEVLMLLKHVNIVKYFDYCIDLNKCRAKVYMETLQMPLNEWIENNNKEGKQMEETIAIKICKDIFNGLSYLHQLGLLHRNLKSSNILLNANGNAKISDFGSSRLTSNASVSKPRTGIHAAMNFRAPETLKAKYSAKADVWSAGCILVHMLSGKVPNHGLKDFDIIQKFKAFEKPIYCLPETTSTKVVEFIDDHLLALPTAFRPSAKRAFDYISHDFESEWLPKFETMTLIKRLGITKISENVPDTKIEDIHSDSGMTLMQYILENNCTTELNEICHLKCDIDKNSLLLFATKSHKRECLKILIEAGADVNCVEKSSLKTPLHFAARNNCLDILKELISLGANIYAKDILEATPLHDAAEYGNLDCLKALIDAGADVNCTDIDLWTPLHTSASGNHELILNTLIKHGVNIHAKNKQGQTPLHLAAHSGSLTCLKELIVHGSDPNAVDDNGDTALHGAARNGQLQSIITLIQAGADSTIKNHHGKTALDYSIEKKNAECIDYLNDSLQMLI